MSERIRQEMKKYLSIERYDHTMRVVDEAKKLCKIYYEDKDKAILAAILHDSGKIENRDFFLKKGLKIENKLEKNMEKYSYIYHAKYSEKIASEVYKIENKDILNAIRYHTTGRGNMSNLEKIIYLSDYIEPSRKHVEKIREMVYNGNLDEALMLALDNTIKLVINRILILNEDTIRARNFLMFENK